MITLSHVRVCFGDKTVLEDFSLTLPRQGILCLQGPSGCGKTTLLRVLCGLETPEDGTVTGVGSAAAVFQEDRLLPWLTVQRNLTAATGISQQQAALWLSRVGLEQEAGSLPEALSGGMRRRVAIARALAAESELLLLDEPFTGLDGEIKAAIYPWIEEAAKQKPVVLVTHHQEEAQALGAKVLAMSGPPLAIQELET